MNKLHLYEDFIKQIESDKISENVLVLDYLNNNISKKEFDIRFNEQLNEGIIDTLSKGVKWLKSNVLDWSLSIFKSIIKSLKSITDGGKKIFGLFNTIINSVKNLQEKYPVIFKSIIIFCVVMVIIVATAGSTYAATTGDIETSTAIINSAIGFIDALNASEFTSNVSEFNFIEAKAYLLDLRDNSGESTYNFSEKSIKVAENSIQIIKDAVAEYKETGKETTAILLLDWLEQGKNMVLTLLEEIKTVSGSSYNIRISTLK